MKNNINNLIVNSTYYNIKNNHKSLFDFYFKFFISLLLIIYLIVQNVIFY